MIAALFNEILGARRGLLPFLLSLLLACSCFHCGDARTVAAAPGQSCPDLCAQDGRMVVSAGAFQDRVVARYPRLARSKVHLVVFADLKRDCPVCLWEAPEWIRPLSQTTDFDLTVVLQGPLAEGTEADYENAHQLNPEQVVVHHPEDRVGAFHAFGVLKVLLRQGKVEWAETGSKSPEEYAQFRQRLAGALGFAGAETPDEG